MKKIIAVAILFGISCAAHAEKMYATVGIGSSDWSTGLSISGGYEFTKVNNVGIAGEVGYQSFGSKTDIFGDSLSAHALYAAAVGRFDLGNKLAATGKLGLAQETVDFPCTVTLGVCSSSESGLLIGAGIEYEFQKNMAVGAEYVSYNGDGVLGARVKFGF